VEERTDIKIVMYLNAQLGNKREVLEGVRVGGIDMDTKGAAPMASFILPLAVYVSLSGMVESPRLQAKRRER
jgi:TRAP-type C4-dicarboxylate transport system substrate-binding protein